MINFSDILLPRAAAGIIDRYEAMTEAERRANAFAVLENPVFQWVLVEAQAQAVLNLKFGLPAAMPDYPRFCLLAIGELLEAVIGEAAETRDDEAGEGFR